MNDEETTGLEAICDEITLHPEVRPAVASVREPVLDDDGFVTHYEVHERLCAVHTLQSAGRGFVCEFEDGGVDVIPYEKVRFVDGED